MKEHFACKYVDIFISTRLKLENVGLYWLDTKDLVAKQRIGVLALKGGDMLRDKQLTNEQT